MGTPKGLSLVQLPESGKEGIVELRTCMVSLRKKQEIYMHAKERRQVRGEENVGHGTFCGFVSKKSWNFTLEVMSFELEMN